MAKYNFYEVGKVVGGHCEKYERVKLFTNKDLAERYVKIIKQNFSHDLVIREISIETIEEISDIEFLCKDYARKHMPCYEYEKYYPKNK